MSGKLSQIDRDLYDNIGRKNYIERYKKKNELIQEKIANDDYSGIEHLNPNPDLIFILRKINLNLEDIKDALEYMIKTNKKEN